MRTFYGDDTYAKSNTSDSSHRLHLLGGIVISKEDEIKLIEIIRDVKSKYTHPNLPMKWNFKDKVIFEKFAKYGKEEEFKNMLIASKEWRKEIIERSVELEYEIICGITESYSTERKKVKKSKDKILTYTFENILMRLGIDAKFRGGFKTYVVLDWPPDGNPQPFVDGFYRLYHTENSSSGHKTICGPLSNLDFNHTLLFAKCNHSPLLQFSDLIIGSLKDYLEAKINEKDNYFASEVFEIYKPKFRTYKGQILKYGILPSSGNTTLNINLRKII